MRNDFSFLPNLVSARKKPGFTTEIARNMYLHDSFKDTIIQEIKDSRLGVRGKYKYSCINFILLKMMVEKQMRQMGDYGAAFLRILGGARPYLTQQSCKNQFYSDLITPLPDKLDVPGTEIHIFYALKMGEKYRARYEQHFAHPIIHEQDMQHEELLACHPQEWAALVKSIVGKEKSV